MYFLAGVLPTIEEEAAKQGLLQPNEAIQAAVAQAMAVPNPPKKVSAGKRTSSSAGHGAPEAEDKKGLKGKKEGPRRVRNAPTRLSMLFLCTLSMLPGFSSAARWILGIRPWRDCLDLGLQKSTLASAQVSLECVCRTQQRVLQRGQVARRGERALRPRGVGKVLLLGC